MEEKELTPSESLALITSVIQEAKSRFRENGFAYIFLGLCCFVAGFGQFILLRLQYYNINYFPYFIMPVAGVITYLYYIKKRKAVKSRNIIGSIFSVIGIFLGTNMVISGFFFWSKFNLVLMPFMLILFSMWPLLSGAVFKNRIFIFAGILINITAYCTFFINREYHPLVLAIVSLVGLVIPGIMFNYSQKENNV